MLNGRLASSVHEVGLVVYVLATVGDFILGIPELPGRLLLVLDYAGAKGLELPSAALFSGSEVTVLLRNGSAAPTISVAKGGGFLGDDLSGSDPVTPAKGAAGQSIALRAVLAGKFVQWVVIGTVGEWEQAGD